MLGSVADRIETTAGGRDVHVLDVIELEETLRRQVRRLDPSVLSPADAARLEDRYLAVRKLADAALAVVAARAAESGEWKQRGAHTPAHDLALRAGTTVSAARDVLDTSSRLAELPATDEAVRRGRLSADQASAVAAAAAANRACERDMLARAETASLYSLREERDRIVAAAMSPDDAAERRRRIHETRSLRFGRAADGAGTGSWRVDPEVQAEIEARLAPFIERRFAAARRDGRREGAEAYRADALLDAFRAAFAPADRPAPAPSAGRGEASSDSGECTEPAESDAGERGPDGMLPKEPAATPKVPAKIIVRIDHSALVRGHTAAGETCEIAGVGPVPVGTVMELLATGDVFWAAVLTRGIDVLNVAHLGRRPSAAQLTALQWRDPCCRAESCSRPVREWDHHVDWARTHHTVVSEMGGFCDHHHDLKTYDRYRIAPSPIAGKVRLLPPDGPDPPRRT